MRWVFGWGQVVILQCNINDINGAIGFLMHKYSLKVQGCLNAKVHEFEYKSCLRIVYFSKIVRDDSFIIILSLLKERV